MDGTQSQYAVVKLLLHPTPEQAALFEKTFGCCRWLWNRMLADASEFYAATDLHYLPTPARYKQEAPFLKEVDSQALCAVHQSLRRAFLDYFRDPAAFHHPRFRSRQDRRDSFTVYCRPYRTGPSITLTEQGIRLPKAGEVRAMLYRRPPEGYALRSVTVSRSRSGKYYCSVTFGGAEAPPAAVVPTAETTLGLAYSPERFYVDSEGRSPDAPDLSREREKLALLQQALSRMARGSGHYEAQLQRIRLLHEHMANRRRDFIHKESRRIADAYDAVCIDPRDLRGQDSGFGLFRACLRYKLARQGKVLLLAEGADAAEIKRNGLAQLAPGS